MNSGNKITLYGHFCTVEACTDGTVTVKEKVDWKRKDEYYVATFLSVDDTWIEVRVSEEEYENRFKEILTPYCRIEGKLCTEIGLGNGIVNHYILIE